MSTNFHTSLNIFDAVLNYLIEFSITEVFIHLSSIHFIFWCWDIESTTKSIEWAGFTAHMFPYLIEIIYPCHIPRFLTIKLEWIWNPNTKNNRTFHDEWDIKSFYVVSTKEITRRYLEETFDYIFLISSKRLNLISSWFIIADANNLIELRHKIETIVLFTKKIIIFYVYIWLLCNLDVKENHSIIY